MKRTDLPVLFVVLLAITDQCLALQECLRTNFMCKPGECIYESYVCDGAQDCANNKDEESCGSREKPCQVHFFGCSDGTCIRNDFLCNGKNDCDGGEDESSCGTQCLSVEYTCADGECLFGSHHRCDGVKNCRDGSDEDNCDVRVTCSSEQFTCSDGSCIKKEAVCDGGDDCPDGDDEFDCPAPPTCSTQETTCLDGSCASSIVGCIWSSDDATSSVPASELSSGEGKNQQCLLGQGCVVKVLGLVFGLIGLLIIVIGGVFYWKYQKDLGGESHYVPLGRHQGTSEAITMDSVT